MMSDSYATRFAHATRAAAVGEPNALAELLRSDLPLGPGERELLALLVTGELNKPAGRPSYGPGAAHIAAAVLYYRAQTKMGGEAFGAKQTAEKLGKSESTIREWDRLTREREELLRVNKLLPGK